jgi:hypothetical protein
MMRGSTFLVQGIFLGFVMCLMLLFIIVLLLVTWTEGKETKVGFVRIPAEKLESLARARGSSNALSKLAGEIVDVHHTEHDGKSAVNQTLTPLDFGTPLHTASGLGRIGMVKWWLEFGRIDANVQDVQLQTPLHLATKNCDSAVVAILLEHGADADATNVSGLLHLLSA